MTQRKDIQRDSFLAIAMDAPWQVSIAIGMVIFIMLDWVLPATRVSNPVLIAISEALVAFSWVFSGFFFVIAGLAYLKAATSRSRVKKSSSKGSRKTGSATSAATGQQSAMANPGSPVMLEPTAIAGAVVEASTQPDLEAPLAARDIEPAPPEPTPLEPALLEPALLEPALLEPALLEPALLEPAPLEPAPLEPAAIEPMLPIEPAPIQLTPTAPEKPTEWSLGLIRDIEWKRFAEVCRKLYEIRGIRCETSTPGSDDGIDLRLYQDDTGQATSIVQCTAQGGQPLGTRPVLGLLGAMTHEKIGKAFFMTGGQFSADAKVVAERNRITLIDGPMLLMMLKRLPETDRQHLLEFATDGDYKTPSCPACETKMKLITGAPGYPEFWECQRYPECGQRLGVTRES